LIHATLTIRPSSSSTENSDSVITYPEKKTSNGWQAASQPEIRPAAGPNMSRPRWRTSGGTSAPNAHMSSTAPKNQWPMAR